MALSSQYQLQDGYLLVTTSGLTPADLESSLAYLEELVTAAARHQYPPILLDRQQVQQNPASAAASELLLDHTADLFIQHGYIRPNLAITATIYRDRRLAILVAPTAIEHILAAESALHARNVNSRYFTDRTAAMTWLTTTTH